MQFTVDEAQAQWELLLELSAKGEEVVIEVAGKPVAKLVPIDHADGPRALGALAGQIWMSDDFDELDAEIEALFYESEIFPSATEEPGSDSVDSPP